MPLVINTNVASLNSQRQLVKSGSDMSQAMERLSSGKRVNTAADDAAGLAIANRMTSQIRGLNQAVRNAYDGISLMQTAEGALDETTNILQRIRELAIQSANGIYADSDRSTLDAEVQQLVLELDRITQTTTFNGQKLLDGNLNGVDLQIGSNAYETVTLEIPSLSAKSLGMGSQSVDMLGAEVADLSSIVLSETDVLINGQSIGKFDGTATPPDTFQDLIDNINDNVLGVSASGYTSLEATNVGDGVLEGVIFQINVEAGDGTGTNTYNISDTKSMDELIEKIGNVTGGNINAAVDEQGKLVLTNNTGSTITVTTTALSQAEIQLVEDATGFDIESDADNTPDPVSARGQIILTSEYDDPITISRGATGTLADLANLGFRENTQAGTVEGVAISTPGVAWGVGDISINGTVVPNDDTDSLQGKIDAINAVTSDTGVIASSFVSATLDFDGVDVTALAATFELNGVVVDLTSVTSTEEIVDAFNALADETGVGASLLGTRVVLEGHASSITFRDGAGAVATGLGDGTNIAQLLSSEDGSTAGDVATGDQVEGGLRLQSENNTPIAITLGNNADVATHGFLEANSTGEGRFGAGLNTISVSTAAQSQRALEVVDRALEEINAVRSGMGAVTNRLEFTISNLMNVSENTTAARSRIIDADFAEETANLSRAQVLQSASQAMLAQANARPQQVLQLLQ
jgi:flagellin